MERMLLHENKQGETLKSCSYTNLHSCIPSTLTNHKHKLTIESSVWLGKIVLHHEDAIRRSFLII